MLRSVEPQLRYVCVFQFSSSAKSQVRNFPALLLLLLLVSTNSRPPLLSQLEFGGFKRDLVKLFQ